MSETERILTKHAPLIGPGRGHDLRLRQTAALAAAQRVPGAGSADDVRLTVGAYLQAMAEDELAAVPSALADLLALLDDATSVAYVRSAASAGAGAGEWQAIAEAIERIRGRAERVEISDQEHDLR